jgi:hypothetical protein
MAWKTVTYKLTSVCPLLMHNGQMADPLNKFAKALKQVTSKRVKTDADYEEMARIEFLAGLYMSKDGPVLPAQMIDAAMINGAKKSKEGVQAKSGLFCPEHAILEYDGPRTTDELWEDERFRYAALVKVGTARVVRTRPIFESWSAVVKVNIEESVVNPSRVDDWIVITGSMVGLGDWRPRYGRYEATRLT